MKAILSSQMQGKINGGGFISFNQHLPWLMASLREAELKPNFILYFDEVVSDLIYVRRNQQQ